jgi:hypothetical protein
MHAAWLVAPGTQRPTTIKFLPAAVSRALLSRKPVTNVTEESLFPGYSRFPLRYKFSGRVFRSRETYGRFSSGDVAVQ